MEPDLEQLFERFARHGDVAALEQVFDRSAPELLRIALHLAHDAAQAEDLVQATFVRAIENAARYEPGRALVPWLIGILAHEAARARRDGRRVVDPGRLEQRASVDPAEASAGREVSSQLAAAVRALPSPYRDVVAPHLLEGERAVDIARKLERAPGTVRMQILRGLELLRKALPPSFAGAALLASGTRSHAAVREIVRARAAELAPSLAASTTTAALTRILGSTMSTKVAVAVVAVPALILLTQLALRDARGPLEESSGSETPEAAPDTAAMLAKPPVEHREEQDAAAARPRTPKKSPSQLPAAPPLVAPDEPEHVEANELAGRVLDTLGQPLAGARVTLSCGAARGFWVNDLSEGSATELLAETTSDAAGEFRFPLERGLTVDVRAESGPLLSAEALGRHAGQFVELALGAGHLVRGVVTRAGDGAAVADARVLFRAWGSPTPDLETFTQADGSYALLVPPTERAVIAAEHAESGTSRWFTVRFGSDGNALEDIELVSGVLVEGRVTDAASGEAIAGATVGEGWNFRRTATTGADGVYRLANCAVEFLDLHASAEGYATSSRSEHPRVAGASVRLDFRLRRGHAAVGRVVDESARPLAGVYVAAVGEGDWTRSARTDEDGRFRVEPLAHDRAHALLLSRRGSASQIYEFPASEASQDTLDLGQITLSGAQLVGGRVVDGAGQPVPDATVTLEGWNSDRFVLAGGGRRHENDRFAARQATSDGEGRFWFGAVAPGSYRLFARKTGRAESASVSVLVRQGDERDDLELAFADGLAIRGSVRDEQGRPLADVHVWAFGEEEGTESGAGSDVRTDGSFEIRGLSPGTYWLTASRGAVRDEDPAEPWLDANVEHVEAGGEPVTLVLARGATIEGVVRDAHGDPVVGVDVQPLVESFTESIVGGATDVFGHFRIVVPRNSRWTIVVYPNAWGTAYKPPFSEPGVVAGTHDLVLTLPD